MLHTTLEAALLAPAQQRLPAALTHALEAVITIDRPAACLQQLQVVCRLAEEYGYL